MKSASRERLHTVTDLAAFSSSVRFSFLTPRSASSAPDILVYKETTLGESGAGATMKHLRPSERAGEFCARYGLTIPILLAPMAGACPPGLSIAVENQGGMGAMGALMSTPEKIRRWVEEFRSHSSGSIQLNTWVPDPPPARNHEAEEKIRGFLDRWGPAVPLSAG